MVGEERHFGGPFFTRPPRPLRASLPQAHSTLRKMKTIQMFDPEGSLIVSPPKQISNLSGAI
jgi:hypothetical protein